MESAKKFESSMEKRKREKLGAVTPNQKYMIDYVKKNQRSCPIF